MPTYINLEVLQKINNVIRYYENKKEAYLEINVMSSEAENYPLKGINNIDEIIPNFSNMQQNSKYWLPLICAWSPDKETFYYMDICNSSSTESYRVIDHTFYIHRTEEGKESHKDEMCVDDLGAELLGTERKFTRMDETSTLKMLNRLVNKEVTLVPFKRRVQSKLFKIDDMSESYLHVSGPTIYFSDINHISLRLNGKWQELKITEKVTNYMYGSINLCLDTQDGYKKIHFPCPNKISYLLKRSDGVTLTIQPVGDFYFIDGEGLVDIEQFENSYFIERENRVKLNVEKLQNFYFLDNYSLEEKNGKKLDFKQIEDVCFIKRNNKIKLNSEKLNDSFYIERNDGTILILNRLDVNTFDCASIDLKIETKDNFRPTPFDDAEKLSSYRNGGAQLSLFSAGNLPSSHPETISGNRFT